MSRVMSVGRLRGNVDAAFVVRGRDIAPRPDPHPDRRPADEEYSRVTNAARYRILGARADAWIAVLTDTELAVVDADTPIVWRRRPPAHIGRADRLVPVRPTALPLVIARSCIGGVDDTAIIVGAADPTMMAAYVPDCGCDACDSGSSDLLEQLDGYVLAVVTGAFRRLTSKDREITRLLEAS